MTGCGLPQGLQANNIGRIAVLLSEKLGQETNGITVSRYCASGLDAVRNAANAVQAGQGDVYIAGGVEFVSRYNAAQEAAHPEDQNEKLQGKEPGQPDAYIPMGLTAENVADVRRLARGPGRVRRSSPRSAPSPPRSRASSTARSSRYTLADGTVVAKDDGPRACVDVREAGRAAAGVPPRAARSRPATRARSTTARPPRSIMSEDKARELGLHAARPDHRRRDLGHRARDHGRRPDRRDQEGARARRHDDRRHRHRRAQRGVRRAGDPDRRRGRHSTTPSSTRTAARSPSATRSA